MESHATITGTIPGAFVEENCTIEHEGRKFSSGGAWLVECTDGYWRGVVYVKPCDANDNGPCGGMVTTWHGKHIAQANFGARYQSTYCRLRSVSFTYEGLHFTGRYCPDTGEVCRVRARKV